MEKTNSMWNQNKTRGRIVKEAVLNFRFLFQIVCFAIYCPPLCDNRITDARRNLWLGGGGCWKDLFGCRGGEVVGRGLFKSIIHGPWFLTSGFNFGVQTQLQNFWHWECWKGKDEMCGGILTNLFTFWWRGCLWEKVSLRSVWARIGGIHGDPGGL